MGMELKQHLRTVQTQQLVITPQLQQAIKLLQLSRMELQETVREELEQNPLLEDPDETTEGDIDEKAPGEASLEAANAETPAAVLVAKAPHHTEAVKGGGGPHELDS